MCPVIFQEDSEHLLTPNTQELQDKLN